MKIALVSPYDFVHPGGVANHITSLDRHFISMGHDVRVIGPASRPIKDFGDRFIKIGNPVPFPSSGSVIRVTIYLHLANTIREVLAREKFDIVHCHEPFMPMLCSAMVRFSDAVNIGTFHAAQGKPGYNFGKPISSWMLTRRQRKLHGRIAVSKAAMNYVSQFVTGGYEIIPNGIDLTRFRTDVEPIEKYCDGKKNILFLGRLEFRKGLNYLLKAYYLLKQEMPDIRLIVVGPGTRLRRRYERWVQKNHVQDVEFVGLAPHEDIPRYYKTADIYCSPATSRESFGIVLLEAMAVGTPVVATNIEGYASVVSDGEDGLLVPPQNHRKLAETLSALLKDDEKRKQMAQKGIIKSQDFSWEIVSRRVLDYYYKVIEEQNLNRTNK